MRTGLLALATLLVVGVPAPGAAQEAGQVGLTVGYPADVGVLWHVSYAVAIRPAFTFSRTSVDSAATGSSTDGWGTGFDISALIYLKKYDNVRTYVSPRFSYSYDRATTTPGTTVGSVPTLETTGHSTGGSGAFGAQFTPTPHFGIYGEFGIAFAHQKTDFSFGPAGSTTGSTWGTFAGVGIVIYP